MKYEYRSANETVGILYKLIEQRFATCSKIVITRNNDTMDLRYDIETDEK